MRVDNEASDDSGPDDVGHDDIPGGKIIHELKFAPEPQQTALTAAMNGEEAATVRYDNEREIAAGDAIVLSRPDETHFGVGTVKEVAQTVVRNAYPKIVSRGVEYGCESVKSLLLALNKHYSEAIRYTTPVTIIFYKVDKISQSYVERPHSDRVSAGDGDTITEAEPPKEDNDQSPRLTTGRGAASGQTEYRLNADPDNVVDALNKGKTIMCVHLSDKINGPWFFQRRDGELYRYHPCHGFEADTTLVGHRSTYAFNSEDIVTAPVSRRVLETYQQGAGVMPKEVQVEISEAKSESDRSGAVPEDEPENTAQSQGDCDG
jgi:hypothetical protein